MAAAARGRRLAQIEHRRVEAALEESEERLQLLVARALDAVVTIDAEGRVASWNPQAVQLFGWSQEEILGRRLSETIVPEALRESHERGLARFRATGQGTVLDQRLEMTALHRDGREFPVEISIAAIRMGGAVSFGAFIRDISDRRRQEAERLRQSEEPFRMLVDGVRDYAITLLDADGRVASWNTGAEQINGYRAEEIVGRSAAVFYPPDTDGSEQLAHELAEAREVGRFESESWRVRKDGTRYLAHVVTTPLLDAGGEVRGYSKVTHDITQRHLAQVALEEKTRALEEAQETLIRKERLAVVGELAGGVSHELRNPLGVIANSVYYLRMVVPESPKVEKHLGILEREVRTATAIVTELLDFSRTRPPTPTLVDLNALVVEQLERITVPGAVTVRRDLAPDLPGVAVDPAQVGLVLGNLISNAVQAMPDGGTLTVASAHSNGSAALAVVDTGTGIAADVLTRIFEPLFTTKNRGIGLGLSIARNLTEANGGTIAVESGPGQGTRFTLRFRIPASKAAPPRPGENGR